MTHKQAPEPGSPTADRETAEDTIKASRAHLDMLRSKRGDAAAHVAKAEKAIAESHKAMADADKEPPRRKKMTDAEQSAEFEKVAREHGAEGDEAEFNGVLRKLARPTGAKTR